MQIETSKGLLVKVANGDAVYSSGKCSDLPLKMQGKIYIADFYMLTLGGCDAVLGVQWMRTVGLILLDFNKLRMEFKLGDQQHCLQGIPPSGNTLIKGTKFGRANMIKSKGIVIQLMDNLEMPFYSIESIPCPEI